MSDSLHRHALITDPDFITAFEECVLDPAFFDHVGHLRAAFLFLQRQPMLLAQKSFSSAILRYATALGKPEKYHATITYALLAIMSARQGTQRCATWQGFLAQNEDLRVNALAILHGYYHEDTLRSENAKKQFVLPDKLSLAAMLNPSHTAKELA